MYFGWTEDMLAFKACFKNYIGSDYIFTGHKKLKSAYYCKYNIHGLLNKIMPFLCEVTQHSHIDFVLCNDDKKNKVLKEYISLLQIKNLTFHKACDIKRVESLSRLPLHQVKMQSVRENKYYTAEWLSILRKLITRPDSIKKIVILRADKHRRFQEDILSFLLKEGFCPVVLDDMSIQEEINLFAGVDIVVGNHGSGLSNLVYCSPGTKILEIMRGDYHYIYPEFVDYTNELLNFNPKIYHQQVLCDSDIDASIEKSPHTNIDRFIKEYTDFMQYDKGRCDR
jgi:hypothetical protein